jgi:hypothetical protein
MSHVSANIDLKDKSETIAMIKLSKDQLRTFKESTEIHVKMSCLICMAFPEVIVHKKNTKLWFQSSNPVPSNRLCFHIKHKLECPHCEFGIASEDEMRGVYFIERRYREAILKRDNFTCQACGYKQDQKPTPIPLRKKNETEADYLYRRFISTLGKAGQAKHLAIAHYSKRYDEETYENRHKVENARTLCVDCHNAETAKHQMEIWLERMRECAWLNRLE